MEEGSNQTAVRTLPSAAQTGRRQLIMRDSVKFLTLLLVTLVMVGITTLLFRSFESHREELAITWAATGRDALQHGRAADAVQALRTSLSYRPDDRDTQMALADALDLSGHTAEAENYYQGLHEAQPGDGLINLQLARLERSRGKADEAIDYYRAAIFGTWSGDAPARRRDTRLELSQYLTERGQKQAAQVELLVAAGNNPDAATQLRIATELQNAGDPKDAMVAYRNAAADGSVRAVADAKSGELCFQMGDYGCASDLLQKALHARPWADEQSARMSRMQGDAARLVDLSTSRDVPAALRSAHLLEDARIAQNRLKACDSDDMTDLLQQWKTLDTPAHRTALRHDDELQDQYRDLVFDSETAAQKACGAATGDDALLLHLHDHPATHFGEGVQ